MAEITLTSSRIANGVWEGIVEGAMAAPAVQVLHLMRQLVGVEVMAMPGRAGSFAVRAPVPAEVLSEGVQTLVMQVEGQTIGQLTLVVGVPLDDDLRTEIGLIRAELDLLKRAFRRHAAGRPDQGS
jgi:hypothetical protein